jgi:LysM repeat protein
MGDRAYRGRHRKQSKVAKTAAALTVTATIPGLSLVAPGTAEAAPPGGWGPIIACESGGNAKAQNPSSSASGLFQMLDSTWHGLGGKGRAKDASEAEQYSRAEKLYSQSGLSPWAASKSCWKGKVSQNPAPKPPAPPPVKPESPPSIGAGDGNYTVKPGDTLAKIAEGHGTTWQKIYDANRNVVKNPSLIRPGQRLHVNEITSSAPVELKAQSSTLVAPPATIPLPLALPLPVPLPVPAPAPAAIPTLADKLASQLDRGFGGVPPKVAQAGNLIKGMFDVERVYGVGSRSGASDHPSGHAIDFMVDSRPVGDRIADFVLRNKALLNVKYIIWRQRYNDGSGWESMEDRGSVTANHYDHVHVSFR